MKIKIEKLTAINALSPRQPENILLSSDESVCCVKLTDFGLSKFTADCSAMSTFCGTTFYIAPELLEITKKISYCKKVDLWSYGVIIFVW